MSYIAVQSAQTIRDADPVGAVVIGIMLLVFGLFMWRAR